MSVDGVLTISRFTGRIKRTRKLLCHHFDRRTIACGLPSMLRKGFSARHVGIQLHTCRLTFSAATAPFVSTSKLSESCHLLGSQFTASAQLEPTIHIVPGPFLALHASERVRTPTDYARLHSAAL